MKKVNKTKLALNKETVKALDPQQLGAVVGGTGGYTCGGTMCESCSYQSAVRVCPRPKML